MNYAVEIGSGDMIYVHTKFHNDWFRHSQVNSRDSQTHRQHGERISLLFESRLVIKYVNL
jgi:hypothetical protein